MAEPKALLLFKMVIISKTFCPMSQGCPVGHQRHSAQGYKTFFQKNKVSLKEKHRVSYVKMNRFIFFQLSTIYI